MLLSVATSGPSTQLSHSHSPSALSHLHSPIRTLSFALSHSHSPSTLHPTPLLHSPPPFPLPCRAAKLGVKLEWQADGSVRTVSGPIPALRVDTRPLPSLSTKPRVAQEEVRDEQVREEEVGEGEVREEEVRGEEVREAWFNSMVAAYTGWKDVRNDPTKAVTFGDGEALPGEVVLAVEEEMERLAVAVPWRRGDVLLVDNLTVQHSRRSFEPPRRILASLANTGGEGEEMREEGDAWGLTDDGGGEREEREECRRGKDESEAGERDEGGGRSEEWEEEGDESEGKVGGGGREGAREGGGGKAESSRGVEVRPEGGQRKERGAVDEGGLREGEKEREGEREGGGKDAKGIHGGEIRPEGEQWKEEEGVAGEEEGREEAGDAEEEEEGGEKEKEKEEVEEDEKGKEKDEDKEKEEEKAEEEDEEEEEEEEEYVYLDLSQAVRRLPRNCRLIIEVGDFEETLGSCLFFQETLVPAAASAPPSNASGPSTFPAGAAAAAGGGVPPALGEQAMAGKQGPAVDHKDPNHESLREFASLWQSTFARDSLLVYSTGRSPTLYNQLKSQVPLLTPDIVIMSVGTEITYGASMQPDQGWEEYLNDGRSKGWEEHLCDGWDREAVVDVAKGLPQLRFQVCLALSVGVAGAGGRSNRTMGGWERQAVVDVAKGFPQLRFQVDSEQRPHKVSFHLEKDKAGNVVEELRGKLAQRGLKAKVIYSGGYDLDILPERAGKGQAMAYLLRQFTQHSGSAPKHTLACGDSGNDAELVPAAAVQAAERAGKGQAMAYLLRQFTQHSGGAPKHTLACGDSGNDAELFEVEGAYGVIVSNAMEELVEWHRAHHSTDHHRLLGWQQEGYGCQWW
ncbi:unnamed protein product [Closterium sp. Naga37s-1]|nr:unnamed protein product [Closterium sp. Naga37s-1]